MKHKHRKIRISTTQRMVVFVVGFALLGVAVILTTQAASNSASFEAESTGQRTARAVVGSDETASGSIFLKFVDQQATPSVGQATSLGVPAGFTAKFFRSGLDSTRDLQMSPGGTLLASQPGKGRVIALPDRNADGVADQLVQIATGNKPHGLAFYGDKLFVAEVDKVVRYNWNESTLTATFDKQLFTVPSPGGHTSRTIAILPDGKLYVSIGSSCNVCVEADPWVGGVIESNTEGASPHVFTSGNRNEAFLTVHTPTNAIWGTGMGRDNLGDDIPPEEINILTAGKHYGWPYCYGDRVRDTSFNASTNFNCATTELPDFKMQAHSAPLGLTHVDSSQFPSDWQGDLLVAFHGSWNRSVPTGYKVVKIDVNGTTMTNQQDFITFNNGGLGRPVDVEFDSLGNLFVSDDQTSAVYIVQRL